MKTVLGMSAALCAASACAQNGLISVGSGEGEMPEVRLYEPLTGQLIDSSLAFDAQNTAGVRVALGDVTGDGVADVIAGPWHPDCMADVNNDGVLSPADSNAWIANFNAGC